jgi:hypothetical protein
MDHFVELEGVSAAIPQLSQALVETYQGNASTD